MEGVGKSSQAPFRGSEWEREREAIHCREVATMPFSMSSSSSGASSPAIAKRSDFTSSASLLGGEPSNM